MSAHGSLVLLVCTLVMLFLLISTPHQDVENAMMGEIQGAWVLCSVEKSGIVISQLPDEVEIQLQRLQGLAELRDVPVDPLEGASVTTFEGTEYITQRHDIIFAKGVFRIITRKNSPTLVTHGSTYQWFFHPASTSVFATPGEPVHSRIEIAGDVLRIKTLRNRSGQIVKPADEVVANFKRHETLHMAMLP